jgi:hypothetical protein
MKNPPPVGQLHPEDFVQQFHNAHMFEEPKEGDEYPTALGSVLRHGKQFASGGSIKKPVEDPATILRALALSRSITKGT